MHTFTLFKCIGCKLIIEIVQRVISLEPSLGSPDDLFINIFIASGIYNVLFSAYICAGSCFLGSFDQSTNLLVLLIVIISN